MHMTSPHSGAGPEDRLAPGAPEEVSSREHLRPDPAATDVAVEALAAVDVDLAPVVVDAWCTTHRLRGVLDVHRVDASGPHAFVHQHDEVAPKALELFAPQRVARPQRVQP